MQSFNKKTMSDQLVIVPFKYGLTDKLYAGSGLRELCIFSKKSKHVNCELTNLYMFLYMLLLQKLFLFIFYPFCPYYKLTYEPKGSGELKRATCFFTSLFWLTSRRQCSRPTLGNWILMSQSLDLK